MTIPDLSASGILTAITIAFALIGFIKGTFKLILTFITLGAAATVGYLTFNATSDLIHQKWPDIPESTPLIVAAVAALATFLILRIILKFILNPFNTDSKKGSGIFGFLVGTALALGGLWLGINQLIYQGSKQEIQYWLAQDETNPPTKLPIISTIKQTFARSTVGEKIADVYPIHDPVDHTLAKLAAMRLTSTPNFTKLATTPTIAKTILNPEVLAYFIDPAVTAAVETNDAQALLDYPSLSTLIQDKALKSDISQIDIEQTLDLR